MEEIIDVIKICKKCSTEKNISDFYKNSNKCKSCEIKRVKEYIRKNKQKVSDNRKARYLKNREIELMKKSEYDIKNRESINEKARKKYNPEKASKYYLKNKERIRKKNKEWIEKNKEYFREANNKNTTKWLKNNPHVVVWRQILYRTIRKFNKIKESSTQKILGYSALDLKNHIENLFTEGMSWHNWGEWHIDHIIPLNSFDSETPIHIVNSLSNLRPLWAEENLKRARKYAKSD